MALNRDPPAPITKMAPSSGTLSAALTSHYRRQQLLSEQDR